MSTARIAGPDAQRLALAVLHLHRMATTRDLHRALSPDRHPNWIRRQLRELAERGMISRITVPPGVTKVWFLTETGRAATGDWTELRERDYPQIATNPDAVRLRTAHPLAVLRTHLAFLEDARRRGDEYGVLDFTPEVHHRVGEVRADAVTADALLRYTTTGPDRASLRAFVEVDRATMSSERLASKLINYARLWEYTPTPPGRKSLAQTQALTPLWHRYYPRFPRLLFVLTGTGEIGLANRTRDLRAMAADHRLVARLVREVPAGAAVLEDLEAHGASAPVWTALDGRTERMGWIDL